MLESIDLSRKVGKEAYKEAKDPISLKLAALQRRAIELKIPVIIVFEGCSAAGKGTLINELILPLDPRGFDVYSTHPPNEEEALRPFLWRFWTRTPRRGRVAIFDRSWYRRVTEDRVSGECRGGQLHQAFEDIRSFERQLADDGNVIIKFFLHISKKEQERRLEKLRSSSATAWRVTDGDLEAHKQYKEHLAASEIMLAETDIDAAPWTIIEATDRRFATLKIFNTVVNALEHRVAQLEQAAGKKAEAAPAAPSLPLELSTSILDQVDLTLSLTEEEYTRKIKARQDRIRELEHEIYVRRIPVVIVYQGWDAAGKGGNIRRLTQNLDPRGYNVVPIAAPNDLEKSHHYLWRFWINMPKAGHITIFDRSWYGRVMVERIEGYCTEAEWKRAYREINEMEQHMTHFGAVLLKFWLHIDPDEQLLRFRDRENTSYKQWKITQEDWRNREMWDAYKIAVEEMLYRTSTPYAPWTIVESNNKWYARVKVLDTVCKAIERRMES
jgi:AMP-polyphosphate phosphotransferase